MAEGERVSCRWTLVEVLVSVSLLATLLVLVWPDDRREWSRRTQSLNNLRNVSMATQQYAVVFQGVIPAGGLDSDPEPQWSWGIQLLPYLEQQSRYQRIDFSQAWNSEWNKKDLSEEIRVFLNPSESDRTPVDGFAITHQTASSRVFGPREGVSLDEVSSKLDGTSSTLMLGEIGTDFPPWARPGNVRDPARGLRGGPGQWGRSDGSGCHVMFLGGNGTNLSPDISPEVLELLADPNNGVPTNDDF